MGIHEFYDNLINHKTFLMLLVLSSFLYFLKISRILSECAKKKNKAFLAEFFQNENCECDTNCGMVEMLSVQQKQKYLGRMFRGEV